MGGINTVRGRTSAKHACIVQLDRPSSARLYLRQKLNGQSSVYFRFDTYEQTTDDKTRH